jgi:hypothetical protein
MKITGFTRVVRYSSVRPTAHRRHPLREDAEEWQSIGSRMKKTWEINWRKVVSSVDRLEHDANPRDSVEKLRVGWIVPEFSTQPVNGDANDIAVGWVIFTPDVFQQTVGRNDSPGVHHQVVQDSELGDCEVYRMPANRDGVLGEVHRDRSNVEVQDGLSFGSSIDFLAAQICPDAGHQFAMAERFS